MSPYRTQSVCVSIYFWRFKIHYGAYRRVYLMEHMLMIFSMYFDVLYLFVPCSWFKSKVMSHEWCSNLLNDARKLMNRKGWIESNPFTPLNNIIIQWTHLEPSFYISNLYCAPLCSRAKNILILYLEKCLRLPNSEWEIARWFGRALLIDARFTSISEYFLKITFVLRYSSAFDRQMAFAKCHNQYGTTLTFD